MRKNKKLISVLLICAVAMMFLAGCGGAAQEEQQPVEPKGTIILATTTSTQDSGLLDYLLPAFTAETGWEVSTIAVGTGKALQMGVDGEADVLLVHARASEDEFMANLDILVERAFDDQCTGANPRYPLMSEIKEIFLIAYNGIV